MRPKYLKYLTHTKARKCVNEKESLYTKENTMKDLNKSVRTKARLAFKQYKLVLKQYSVLDHQCQCTKYKYKLIP